MDKTKKKYLCWQSSLLYLFEVYASGDKLGAGASVLCLFSSMVLFREADINQHPRSSNIISSCPSLLTSLRLNLILKKKYTSYEQGKKRNWPFCIFQSVFGRDTCTKKTFYFPRKHLENVAHQNILMCGRFFNIILKTGQSPKSDDKCSHPGKIHNVYEVPRREAALLHSPVKSMPSECCFSDSVAPNQH